MEGKFGGGRTLVNLENDYNFTKVSPANFPIAIVVVNSKYSNG